MMPTNKDEFLKSGLLEQYVMGLCSEQERLVVEGYISEYDSVRQVYEELQHSISELADSYAIVPPTDVKAKVMEAVQPSGEYSTPQKEGQYGKLAMGLALALAVLGIYSLVTISELQSDLKGSEAQYAQLLADCETSQLQAAATAEQLEFYVSSDTRIAELTGGAVLPGFQAVAHYNKATSQYALDIVESGSIPAGKCLYLWGDKDGKMIKLQRITDTEGHEILVFDSKMESLNLTLEDATALVDHPDVSQLVASAAI